MTLSALVFSCCGFFIASRGARHARAHAHACALKYWLNWASLIEAVLFAPVTRCRPRPRPRPHRPQLGSSNGDGSTSDSRRKNTRSQVPIPQPPPSLFSGPPNFVTLDSLFQPPLRTPSFFSFFSLFHLPSFFAS